jgi:hypothetical protein
MYVPLGIFLSLVFVTPSPWRTRARRTFAGTGVLLADFVLRYALLWAYQRSGAGSPERAAVPWRWGADALEIILRFCWSSTLGKYAVPFVVRGAMVFPGSPWLRGSDTRTGEARVLNGATLDADSGPATGARPR